MADNKRTKVRRNRKLSDISSSSFGSSSNSSDDEDDIVDCDLKPIKEYIGNRREMAKQLFMSVKSDKIRMMLPQVLRKMPQSELEEWCANELIGMSKKRISSILNGQPMMDSSATEDSDNSDIVLEIISDTEDFFTDDSASKKNEASKKTKTKRKRNKENSNRRDKTKLKRNESNLKIKQEIKVEKERPSRKDREKEGDKSKDKEKEKEGDSLLDLLELEMRARAIRALIRKEEDVIATGPSDKNDVESRNNISSLQNQLKDVTKSIKESERLAITLTVSTQQVDEDIMMIVQQPPTIELISSDSEDERSKRNKTESAVEKPPEKSNEERPKDLTEPTPEKLPDKPREPVEREEGELEDDEDETIETNTETPVEVSSTFKKLTKRPKTRGRETESVGSDGEGTKEPKGSEGKIVESAKVDCTETVVVEEKSVEKEIESAKSKPPEKRETSIEADEIIDLDDYPDDMDIIEGDKPAEEEVKRAAEKQETGTCEETEARDPKENPPGSSSETWASRYYNTDDVQTVIKESRIQSEIRNRLRERQRLSKKRNSPNSSSEGTTPEQKSDEQPTPPTSGSVEEYLALKSATSSGDATNLTSDETPAQTVDELPAANDTNTSDTSSKDKECETDVKE